MTDQAQQSRIIRIIGVLVKIIFAWAYAMGVTRLILLFANLPVDSFRQGIAILALLLLLASLTWQRYSLIVTSGLALILAILGYLSGNMAKITNNIADELRSWFDFVISWFGGQAQGSDAQLEFLALVVCLLFASFMYFALARFNLPFLSLVILVLISTANAGLKTNLFLPWVFLSGIATAAAFARRQERTYRQLNRLRYLSQARFMLQSLPIAVLGLMLAIGLSLILPPAIFRNNTIIGFANDLTDLAVPNRTDVNQSPDFSIGLFGFYPLAERLGGPVKPSILPVMQIDGYPQDLLLRGAVSSTYDGGRWIRTQNNLTMRFDSLLWANEQTRAFALDLPDFSKINFPQANLIRQIQYRLIPLRQATRTIYLAGRPITVKHESIEPFLTYFDANGQIFVKNWLQPGQSITLQTQIFLTGNPDFNTYARQTNPDPQAQNMGLAAAIYQINMQLPDRPEYKPQGELSRLVQKEIGNETNPYAKAVLLRNYLMKNCQYNLQVSVPPPNADFVTYFIQTKEGYCVYFATALTMMCRLADIPARYIEGFYAPASSLPNGRRILTGQNAHAWTEIYLSDIGWVSMDATPGENGSQSGALVSPAVTGAPMPSITPNTASPAISAQPTGSPGSEEEKRRQLPSEWWFLAILILPLGYFFWSFIRYQKRHQHKWLRGHFPDNRSLGLFYWIEMLKIFNYLGIKPEPGETPRQFIERIYGETNWLAGRRQLIEPVQSSAEKLLYSQHAPSEEELAAQETLYLILERTLQQNCNWLLFVFRRICYHKHENEV